MSHRKQPRWDPNTPKYPCAVTLLAFAAGVGVLVRLAAQARGVL